MKHEHAGPRLHIQGDGSLHTTVVKSPDNICETEVNRRNKLHLLSNPYNLIKLLLLKSFGRWK